MPDAGAGRAGLGGGPQAGALQARTPRAADLRRPILRPPALRPAPGRAHRHRHTGPDHGPHAPRHAPAQHGQDGRARRGGRHAEHGFPRRHRADPPGNAQRAADGLLLGNGPAPDPAVDREILARPAEHSHRAEGDDGADGRAGLLRGGPPFQGGSTDAPH